MIQRLLRGKAIYVYLGLLSAVLSVWVLRQAPPELESIVPSVQEAPVSWSTEVDFQALVEQMKQHPDLRIALVSAILVMMGLGLGGFAMAAWGFSTGAIRSVWRHPRVALPPWSFGEAIRIVLVAVIVALLLPILRVTLRMIQPAWPLDLHLWIVISMLLLDVFVVLTVLIFASGKRGSSWQTLGISRSQCWPAVRMGLKGYTAIFPWLFVLLFVVAEIARRVGFEPPLETIHRLLFYEQRPLVLSLTVILACVIGPIAEEVFFRGVIYSAMRKYLPFGVAIAINGCLFALIHTNVLGFLPIMVLGGTLAYLYERTGSLLCSIVVHVVHNSLLMTVSIVLRHLLS